MEAIELKRKVFQEKKEYVSGSIPLDKAGRGETGERGGGRGREREIQSAGQIQIMRRHFADDDFWSA